MLRIQSFAVTSLCLLTMMAFFPIRAEERTASQEGVEVIVARIEDSLKGFRAFKVSARNTTQEPRSVQLEIYLNNRHRK